MNKIIWCDINKYNQSLFDSSGVYAWYYRPIISTKDIDNINSYLSKSIDRQDKIIKVKKFLQKYLLDFYKEDPYFAVISGELKPKYSGRIVHEDQVSSSFAEKVVDQVILLSEVKEILEAMDDSFLSPIYIGMSKSLKERLLQHKTMIEGQAEKYTISDFFEEDTESIGRDQCFANRVVNRKYILSSLFVVIKKTDTYNPIENILNRINYPILGRN